MAPVSTSTGAVARKIAEQANNPMVAVGAISLAVGIAAAVKWKVE